MEKERIRAEAQYEINMAKMFKPTRCDIKKEVREERVKQKRTAKKERRQQNKDVYDME